MQVNILSLEQLVSKYYFQIPFFQRSYVWEKEQWNQFLEDILDVNSQTEESVIPYFIGNIVVKDDKEGTLKVVDGQQRLTTIMLFIKVYTERGRDKLSGNWIDKCFYHSKITSNDKLVRLQHNYHDKEIFEAIINLKKGDSLSKELQDKYKNNNILKCYKFFMSQKASNYGFDSGKINVLYEIDFEKISSNIKCVLMHLSKDQDEQQIFHTINTRSVRLEGSDLLKNIFFDKNQVDFYEKTWFTEFEKDEETSEYWIGGKSKEKNLDIFLNAYLTVVSKGKYYNTKELFKNYSEYFRIVDKSSNNEEVVSDIIEKAKVFRKNFISIQKIDETLVLNASNRISILLAIKQRIHLPFVYYVLTQFENDKISEKEKEKMIRLIESYFIRSIVVVSERGKNARFNVFNKGKLIKNKVSSQSELFEALRWDNESMPSDEEFKEALAKMKCSNSATHKNRVKCLLYFIERYLVEKANQKMDVSFEDLRLSSYLPTKKKDLEEGKIEEKIGNWKLEIKGVKSYSNGDYFSNNREQETDQEAILARSEWLAKIACEIWKTNYTDEDVAYVDNE